MSLDPLDDYLPIYESDHPPPEKSRTCRICRQTMRFTHYDRARFDMGEIFFPKYRWYAVDLAVLIGILIIGALVANTLGIITGILAMLISGPLLYYWRISRIVRRAVWRCKQCDGFFIGPSLSPWKAP